MASHQSIHKVRAIGENICKTEGSKHYRVTAVDPIEYLIANGMFEDFAVGNVLKYITRFKHTRNIDDLKKVSDYAHLLAGLETIKRAGERENG